VPLRQAQVALPAPRSSPHVLAVYNPAAHARDVVKLLVGAFTLMTIALAGGGTLATAGGRAAAVARRSSGKVGSTKVKHYKERWPGEKPGDGSRLWRWPGTASLDRISVGLPARVAPASPLLARLLTDGSYLRSMLGSLWVALPFSALGLGAAAVADVHGHALPPNEGLVIALCVVGVLDTFAGFVGALVFATGVLVSGGVGGADGARTLMGLGAIWFAAPLVASAARPLRRPPSVTREQRWDRGADFVIAALIAAWAIQKMVGGLPGLSGFDLPIVSRADVIALAVLAAMVIRMALESVAASLFPKRLETVQPERLPYAPSVQRLAAAAVRTAIFVFVAVAFIGVRWQLFAGATLFVIPQVLTVYEHRFPNFDRLYRGLPKGIVKSVLMLAVGVVAGILVFHRHRPPADLIADAFVLLSLPGFALSLLDLVGREGPGHEMHWRARFAGVAVLAAGIALALR
jgi:hypothetical protein